MWGERWGEKSLHRRKGVTFAWSTWAHRVQMSASVVLGIPVDDRLAFRVPKTPVAIRFQTLIKVRFRHRVSAVVD